MFDRETFILLLKDEMVQRREEGCEVDQILSEFTRLGSVASEQELMGISERLESLPASSSFPYREPSELEEIRRQRPAGPRKFDLNITDTELQDKMYAGWLGRCVGCMLGKPVEGWSKEKLKKYLQLADAYPLVDYIPEVVPHPAGYEMQENAYENQVRGKIAYVARDDDLDYTVINLQVIERSGLGFTPYDVAETWLTRMPYKMTYTAERAAYRNLVNDVNWPKTATYMNPYREWIGAQIRADVWGYAAPGNPELAATLAYRDASLSHVKNGIYGEMFVAAMISAAFATNEVDQIVLAGLSEIPESSRLAETVRNALKWARQSSTWEEAWDKVIQKYGSYSWMHTINNAAIVILGLVYGEHNFQKGIAVSVLSGLDNDCDGATCGSILGAVLGSGKLKPNWIEPLNDRLKTAVFGFLDCRISDLAKRTFLVAKRLKSEV